MKYKIGDYVGRLYLDEIVFGKITEIQDKTPVNNFQINYIIESKTDTRGLYSIEENEVKDSFELEAILRKRIDAIQDCIKQLNAVSET